MYALRLALCLPALAAAPALAELRVTYVESAPDWLTIQNLSQCDLGPFELAIDLGDSPAGLIFDTSGEGAGFAAYAPLEVVEGADHLTSVSAVTDGDSRLVLGLDFLAGRGTVRIAVDLDDTSPDSEFGHTIISPAEFAGSTAQVRQPPDAPPISATFGPEGVAVLPLEACIA